MTQIYPNTLFILINCTGRLKFKVRTNYFEIAGITFFDFDFGFGTLHIVEQADLLEAM